MNDMNDKLRQRWQDRRKKSFNWIKILIMLAALIAILFVMSQLGNMDNIKWQSGTESPSAASDTTEGHNPASEATDSVPIQEPRP